jgi:hypothetical protein
LIHWGEISIALIFFRILVLMHILLCRHVQSSLCQVFLAAKKLAEQALAQPWHRLAVVDIARVEAQRKDFTLMVNDDMQFATEEPARRTLVSSREPGKDLAARNTQVVAHCIVIKPTIEIPEQCPLSVLNEAARGTTQHNTTRVRRSGDKSILSYRKSLS